MPDTRGVRGEAPYRRYLRAAEIAAKREAPQGELLHAMTQIIDLLGAQVLADEPPPVLPTDAVALLAVSNAAQDGKNLALIFAAMIDGQIARLSERRDEGSGLSWGAPELCRLDGYSPREDEVVALYGTSRAKPFRNERNLVVVVQRRRSTRRVFLVPIDGRLPAWVGVEGGHLPPWMRHGRVALPLDADALEAEVGDPPPDELRVAWRSGHDKAWVGIDRGLRLDIGRRSLEVDDLAAWEPGVIVARRDQRISLLSDQASGDEAWNWPLANLPAAICRLPDDSFGRRRLLAACESGTLLIGVELPKDNLPHHIWGSLAPRWEGPLEPLPFAMDSTLPAEMLSPPGRSSSSGFEPLRAQASVAMLRVRLERALAGPPLADAARMDLAAAFGELSSEADLQPLLDVLCREIRSWIEQRCDAPPHAPLVFAIYKELPHFLEDMLDIELRGCFGVVEKGRLYDPKTDEPTTPQRALELLKRHASVTRGYLLDEGAAAPANRVTMLAERWANGHELLAAIPSPPDEGGGGRGVLRSVPSTPWVLVIRRDRLERLGPDAAGAVMRVQIHGDSSWVAPVAGCFVTSLGNDENVLVCGERHKISVYHLDAAVISAACSSIPLAHGESLFRVTVAEPGGCFAWVSTADQEIELRLYDLAGSMLRSTAAWPYGPCDVAVAARLSSETPARWLLAHDMPDESMQTIVVGAPPEPGAALRIELAQTWPLQGRVTTITMLGGFARDDLRIVAGTTRGFVLCYLVESATTSLRLSWVRRCPNAVRYLACNRSDQMPLLSLVTTEGRVEVFGIDGDRVWTWTFAHPIRSIAFSAAPGESPAQSPVVATIDVQGNIARYALVRREEPKAELFGMIPTSPAPAGSRARTECSRVIHSLHLGTLPPLQDLVTHLGRRCVVIHTAERLAQPVDSAALEQDLRQLCSELEVSELRPLARVHNVDPSHDRGRMLSAMLDPIGLRAESSTDRVLSFVVDAIHGVGHGLSASALLTIIRETNLPASVASDAGVDIALMLECTAGDRTLNRLLDLVAQLGPEAVRLLRLFVTPSERDLADALTRAISMESVNEIQIASEVHPLARLLLETCSFAVSLGSNWEHARSLGSLAARLRKQVESRYAPHEDALSVALLQLLDPFVATESLHLRNAQEQLGVIEDLLTRNAIRVHHRSEPWKRWLASQNDRLNDRLNDALRARRQWIEHQSRLCLSFSVRWTATGVAIVEALLKPEGPVLVHKAIDVRWKSAKGVRLIVGDASVAIDHAAPPATLRWVFGVDPGVWTIEFSSTCWSGGEQTIETWTAALPEPASLRERGLLLQLPDFLQNALQHLLAVPAGVHVVAIPELLGVELLASRLSQVGARLVPLDDIIADVRGDLGGVTLDALCLSSGRKRRATSGIDVIFSGTQTAQRLIEDPGGVFRDALRQRLAASVSHPILWLLPPTQAGPLEGLFEGLVRFLRPFRAEQLTSEISAWLRLDDPHLDHAFRMLRGDLRLLDIARRTKELRFPELLKEGAEAILEDDLLAFTAEERARIVLIAWSTVLMPLDALRAGMTAAEGFSSTVRENRRGKELARADELLDDRAIASLRANRQPPPRFAVRGWSLRRTNQLPAELIPIGRLLQRPDGELRAALNRLLSRGIVEEVEGIFTVAQPYRCWLQERIREPLMRSAIRFATRQHVKGLDEQDRLGFLRAFPFSRLGPVSAELPALCPEVPRSNQSFLRSVAALFSSDPPSIHAFERVARSLTGRDVSIVQDAAGMEVGSRSEGLDQLREAIGDHALIARIDAHGKKPRYLVYLSRRTSSRLDLHAVLSKQQALAILIGPGASTESVESSPSVAVFDEDRLKSEVIVAPDLDGAFWTMVRNRVGLAAFSPFQAGSALPADSPVFVGRTAESRRILDGVNRNSFLIVGPRQIGKTSLLRHLQRQLDRSQFTPIWFDAAGERDPQRIERGICRELHAAAGSVGAPADRIETAIEGFANRPMPVILINEVDGLCEADPDFLIRLRTLTEQSPVPKCQCVMVGYHAAYAKTRDVAHPFFHFVQGKIGEKAFVLGPVDDSAVAELFAQLDREPLCLEWESPGVRSRALERLIDTTYRIPLLVQAACHRLVEHMDRCRRIRITRQDLDVVFDTDESTAWRYIDQFRGGVWGADSGSRSGKSSGTSQEDQQWTDLALASMVRSKYLAHPPLASAPLDVVGQTGVGNVSFSANDVLRAVDEVLPTGDFSKRAVTRRHHRERWYATMLEHLSLTVLIAPVSTTPRRYAFFANMYPRELLRELNRSGRSIDDRILETILEIDR